MLANKLRAATAAGGAGLAIEDVFSTYLYTGNGTTQTITNGIDLAGEGGLVWLKRRNSSLSHWLLDTSRGGSAVISSDITNAEFSASAVAFNSDGFDLTSANQNTSSDTFAAWTFRKAPRFFDVVTYTGNGGTNVINHSLGQEPGMIIVKRTNAASSNGWGVWHRSTPTANAVLLLNTTSAQNTGLGWFDTPTSTTFTVKTGFDDVNDSGSTYVAYLFAHDPLGPSGDGSDGFIACGVAQTTTSDAVVDLGWEPQFIIYKASTTSGSWRMFDSMRGLSVGGNDSQLYANLTNSEDSSFNFIELTSTGFVLRVASENPNQSYIYIAIRRGPMRAPTSGTEVYTPISRTGDSTSNSYLAVNSSPVDLAIIKSETVTRNWVVADRLRGDNLQLSLNTTTGDEAGSGAGIDRWDTNTGVYLTNGSGSNGTDNYSNHFFRRAPGFFDVVAYAGNATVGRTVSHNLGVAPEMMIVKNRTGSGPDWAIYYGDPTDYLKFTNVATADTTDYWNDTAPTESVFTLGNKSDVNGSGRTYIAYLFATLPGISKVGSYTGNGSSQTINCGFTSGARFVLIKRTDSTGDWYIWDTARGIVTGNDPHLSLNNTAAEVTTDDSIDPDSSGFIVNQVAATNINVSSASYIYLAIS